MSGKKNLHEGNILYFGLKVCKKTGTKKFSSGFHIDVHVDQRHKKTHTTELHAVEFFCPSSLVILG